ncbi:MAG TPA: EAL domain-containing protein [Burkholderiales bacterium]|nr:EAL domain-containing protein [Burkholderiales bacterium]
MNEAVRILFVEDVRTDAELEVRELRRAGMKVVHELVETEPDFLDAVARFVPHIILSDFSMPQFDGMAALALAQKACPQVPFIFVSGTLGEEYAIRALQHGASDYVLKSNLIRLPAAVSRALRETAERAARRSAEQELAAAQQRMRQILESLDDVVWSRAIGDRRFNYLGPAVIATFGRVPEEFLSAPELWWASIHAGDREAVAAAYQALFDSGTAFDLEYRVQRPDGEIRWVNDRGRSIAGIDGHPERVDGILRDITDRIAERQRIARLTRIRDLSSAVNSAIVRLREPGRLYEEVCRIAIEIGGFQSVRFVTFDATGQAGALAAALGGDIPAFDRALAAYNLNTTRSQSILAESVRTRRPAFKDATLSSSPDPAEPDARARASASLPFVVKDEVVAALVLEASGQDVFDTDEAQLLQDLANNISFALELGKQQEQIDYLAYYDVLTGLPNRRLFNDRLAQAITAARREGDMLALAMFDITRLRAINETHGERAGDHLLREIARRLVNLSTDSGRVARLGGDQFALMIPGIHDVVEAGQLLGDSRYRFWEEPVTFEGRTVDFSARGGVALYPNDGPDADALFHNAESALEQARKSTEALLFYAPEVNARIAERLDTEARLRKAASRHQFELHYQPKIDLHARRAVGLEALIRWRDPDKGLIPPAAFVPLLEETGLILEAGNWAIEEAVAQYRRWAGQGLNPPRIAVNISAVQLHHSGFVDQVAAILARNGAGVGLDMEITESMLMENVDEGVEKLRSIRDMGVQISIDDFGTGYSSLAYISRLPVNILKIDRSFINGMTEDPDKTSIVSTIIALGHGLRMQIVAEGVETEEQSNLLRLLRCDQIQGYLVSQPLPAEAMAEYLRKALG